MSSSALYEDKQLYTIMLTVELQSVHYMYLARL